MGEGAAAETQTAKNAAARIKPWTLKPRMIFMIIFLGVFEELLADLYKR